jgi:hypothetical protein
MHVSTITESNFQSFWSEIRGFSFTERKENQQVPRDESAGDVIKLSSASLFGCETPTQHKGKSGHIFIRQCYIDLANMIFDRADMVAAGQSVDGRPVVQALIRGTPGIG